MALTKAQYGLLKGSIQATTLQPPSKLGPKLSHVNAVLIKCSNSDSQLQLYYNGYELGGPAK